MHIGWDGPRRVHGTVLHADIRGDRIWIQYDGTNRPLADELVRACRVRRSCWVSTRPSCDSTPTTAWAEQRRRMDAAGSDVD